MAVFTHGCPEALDPIVEAVGDPYRAPGEGYSGRGTSGDPVVASAAGGSQPTPAVLLP